MTLLPMIASTGRYGTGFTGTAGGSAAWGTANRIIYAPLRIPEAFTVLRVFWVNLGTVNGNVNLGLYDAAGGKLWETGSVAMATANVLQFVDIANQTHAAGLYYVALQESGTTATIMRVNPSLYYCIAAGVMIEDAASFALPATATFAKNPTALIPVYGLDLRGTL